MNAMTPIQESVLNFVKSFQLVNGCPPSRAEISDHYGWTSANAAQQHLIALARKGVIRLLPNEKRGIRVLQSTEILKLPERTPIQLQALEVRRIWDELGVHDAAFPEALTALLDMVLR